MPVTFISKEHRRRYGRYHGELSDEQLARYFYLDDADRALIERLRPPHNRLGFAIQLCTVRFLGTFLNNPTDVPVKTVIHVAAQLAIENPKILPRYAKERTCWKHASQIKAHYGYRDFTDRREGFRLVRWLYARAWMSEERPSVLFDLATARLIERKVLLPGATTLERLVARVRDRATRRLWQRLASAISKEQAKGLQRLLQVPDGERTSTFDRLRQGPRRVSGPALVAALERLHEIRALGVGALDIALIPPNRVAALARQAVKINAQGIARMDKQRRVATLVAFACEGEAMAADDALDVFDALMTDISSRARITGEKTRLSTIHTLDTAALCLVEASRPLLDDTIQDDHVRSCVFARISKTQLQQAIESVTALTRPTGGGYHKERIDQYGRVRVFLRPFLQTIHFKGTSDGEPLLQALQFLGALEAMSKPNMAKAPRATIPRSWRPWVITTSNDIDRRAYTLCVLEQLQDRLRRRDVFVNPSNRWSDPRLKLLRGETWQTLKPQVCRSLGRNPAVQEELKNLTERLDQCYRETVAALPNNPDVTIECVGGHDRLSVSRLDKLDEPASLIELRAAIDRLLPRVDLPEALLEIEARTRFADTFTHLSERNAVIQDFPVSLCAVLMAEACNIGLDPIVSPDVAALTQSRLSWISQNYIRQETITQANANLVNYQATLPLAHQWGGGDVASADGLRWVLLHKRVKSTLDQT